MGVLQRHVQVRQDQSLGHQRQHVVHRRIGIDVVQPDPGTVLPGQLAQFAAQLEQPRLDRAAVHEVGAVAQVHAVGAGVLRDDQQLLHAGLEQILGLAHHLADGAAVQVATQTGDDAERTAVVAAFRDLQVGIVARRELDAACRHQVAEGIVWLGQMLMDIGHDLFQRMGAGDGQHAGVNLAHQVAVLAALPGACAQTAGDDDLAVLMQRLADGIKRFGHGFVNEAAGIDHDQVGAFVLVGDLVALGAQLRDDALGIDERLGAAQRDEADAGDVLADGAGSRLGGIKFLADGGSGGGLFGGRLAGEPGFLHDKWRGG